MEIRILKEKEKYVGDDDKIKQMNIIQKTGTFFTMILLLIAGLAGLAIITLITSLIWLLFNH